MGHVARDFLVDLASDCKMKLKRKSVLRKMIFTILVTLGFCASASGPIWATEMNPGLSGGYHAVGDDGVNAPITQVANVSFSKLAFTVFDQGTLVSQSRPNGRGDIGFKNGSIWLADRHASMGENKCTIACKEHSRHWQNICRAEPGEKLMVTLPDIPFKVPYCLERYLLVLKQCVKEYGC